MEIKDSVHGLGNNNHQDILKVNQSSIVFT